jgi:hypothetical protein
MRKLLYPLYVAEVALIVWSILRASTQGQADVVVTGYLLVIVGALSVLIAQSTFHFSLHQRDQARDLAAPYVLLVGRHFGAEDPATGTGQPEFSWDEVPTYTDRPSVRYGLLNQGGEVVILKIVQSDGLFKRKELRWQSMKLSESTRWRGFGIGRGYREIPYPSKQAVPSTPIFVTWLNVCATFSKPFVIYWANPESKESGKLKIVPEKLPIASLSYHKQQRDPG